jgi:hypothetical protein
MNPTDPFIWEVRTYIYQHFVATTHAPTRLAVAAHFALSAADVADVFAALAAQHALFLDAESGEIQIANPFSAVPTNFITEVNGQRYWANCAWDSLGVIVAVGGRAGQVQARCAADGQPLAIAVVDGEVVDNGAIAHVLTPFRHWYDDMVHT